MEKILNDAFAILNQGVAAMNAAKAAEGLPVTQTRPIVPVQLPPSQRGTGAMNWNVIGGLAVAGLIAWMVFKKKG